MAAFAAEEAVDVEEVFNRAGALTHSFALSMALKAVIELEVLEIIARAGPAAQLSAEEIASQLPAANPDAAAAALDRILGFLASYGVLTCSLGGGGAAGARRYGLADVCRFLTKDPDGVSLAALLLMNLNNVRLQSWQHLKDAVLEGVIPFEKAHGMTAFEYHGTDPKLNQVFNQAMFNHTTIIVNKILDTYKGFQGITHLVDVGGGIGATLQMILSRYPHVKGVNFDLPHVICDAPPLPGVEHVSGDMFVSVPSAEAIFMKWILHDWSNEHCIKILKNCWKALPDSGKVIIIEYILPETPEMNDAAHTVFYVDLCMLTYHVGGKERTQKEFESLARQAGFSGFKVGCSVFNTSVLEFYK